MSSGARSAYGYDSGGFLTSLKHYDAIGAVVANTSTTRDRAGNILSQVETGPTPGTTSYSLDALYRLSTADYPGAANDELFTYDKVGNRKTYTKGSLTANATTRYYNYTTASNRIQDIRIGSTSGTLESGFTNDFEGRLTSQTGIGAKTLTWDAKSRIKTVGAETYRYDPMDYRIGRSGGSMGNRDYFLEGEHLESEYSGSTLQAKYFRGSSIDELVAGYLLDTDGKLKPYLFHQDQLTSTTAVTGHNGAPSRVRAMGRLVTSSATPERPRTARLIRAEKMTRRG